MGFLYKAKETKPYMETEFGEMTTFYYKGKETKPYKETVFGKGSNTMVSISLAIEEFGKYSNTIDIRDFFSRYYKNSNSRTP